MAGPTSRLHTTMLSTTVWPCCSALASPKSPLGKVGGRSAHLPCRLWKPALGSLRRCYPSRQAMALSFEIALAHDDVVLGHTPELIVLHWRRAPTVAAVEALAPRMEALLSGSSGQRVGLA